MSFEQERRDTPFEWLLQVLPTNPAEFARFQTQIDDLAVRLADLSKVHLWAAAAQLHVFYARIEQRETGMLVGGMLMGALHTLIGGDEPLPVCTPIGESVNAALSYKRN